ncbi:MAG: hypothetical protein ACUZ77_08645 [Candidatus Brocadiales bacterium]
MHDYFVCPNCGVDVPIKAKACPDCGSDENTGWSEDTMYDTLDLPEIETPTEQPPSSSLFQNKYFISIVTIVALLAFLLIYVL